MSGWKPRCPTEPRFEGDIVGCGSEDVEGPDWEGLYDCHECGIWFTEEAARGPAQEKELD